MRFIGHACLFILAYVFLSAGLQAQNYEKVWFNDADSVNGYYALIKPNGPRIQGAIILFGEYGSDAVSLLPETKIQNVASVNDLLTVCMPTGNHLFMTDVQAVMIKKVINDVAAKFGIGKDRFAMGGFSAGGTIALRYTELTYEHPEEFEIRPRAVFTADAPVDLASLYKTSVTELSGRSKGWWIGDDKIIIDSLSHQLGVLPDALSVYRKASPFMVEDSLPGNEKWLSAVPYRTYHDVDVAWSLKNRQRSIFNLNMLNASELVKRLEEQGNTQAEFIASKVPGRRASGQMHPHSWNIVDETDLVYWIREKLEFLPGDLSKKYSFNAEGWGRELFLFPFDFAPSIAYKGLEELRFAPGWGKPDSDEKWAYTFVWWLQGHYEFNEKILEENLESYYSGLNKRKAIADKDDMNAYFPAKAKVQKTETMPGDLSTYTGKLHFYDAQVTKKPADLYCKIHVRACSGERTTILFFEVSAFPGSAPVWKKLDKINTDFTCVSSK